MVPGMRPYLLWRIDPILTELKEPSSTRSNLDAMHHTCDPYTFLRNRTSGVSLG